MHTDRGTARTTAKFLEYPVSQLRLAGPSWPAGPFARLVLTLLAAVAVGLLPTAWRVVRRRRAGRPSPGTSPA